MGVRGFRRVSTFPRKLTEKVHREKKKRKRKKKRKEKRTVYKGTKIKFTFLTFSGCRYCKWCFQGLINLCKIDGFS